MLLSAVLCPLSAVAQWQQRAPMASNGPYNAVFLADGSGLKWQISPTEPALKAHSPWSISCWFEGSDPSRTTTLIAGLGDPQGQDSRYIGLKDGKLMVWLGGGKMLAAPGVLSAGGWHFAAASFDGGTVHLYADGEEVANGKAAVGNILPSMQLAPAAGATFETAVDSGSAVAGLPGAQHFGGRVASFLWSGTAMGAAEISRAYKAMPDFSLVEFQEGTKHWPVQTHGQAGYSDPQDPGIMPRSNAPFSAPVARPLPAAGPALEPSGANKWVIARGWKLSPAPKVDADAEKISAAGFDAASWWTATVPGTVLTTMIDRGVYPDSDYGLNNMAIPESLNKQDYWYRVEFPTPTPKLGKHFALTFNGINYAAAVWLNGKPIGKIKGAFIRGAFDVTNLVAPGGVNVLAVRISPPPHPGIPNEQSVKGGPGENGGIMVIDGPTFVATEGWDWIPGIRDRNTGLWQDVTLTATKSLRIGDPQVITTLPLPDTNKADLRISVPVDNMATVPVVGKVTAWFDSAGPGKMVVARNMITTVVKRVTLSPGQSTVEFTPAEFAQLTVQNPRLWWPNGYGKPELYKLHVSVSTLAGESDSKDVSFGIREITYELSLFDSSGHLRRVEYNPTTAKLQSQQVIDISHEGMRQIAPPTEWAASIVAGAENSTALATVNGYPGMTDLIIKVNGVRIACRGGNWGMDDSRKRVSREHLEPFFRLAQNANLNIIRNWVGQDTEENFYDLADEYGQLVWNDFWASTQNYNLEPQDPALFLENARDVISRFRNHPSIVMWCGRNEGVPQPIITNGLEELIRTLDGTRYYSPSSNQVNLRNSGPYSYKDPSFYYRNNKGFSVELGIPSMSTLESFRSTIPEADQWPINDDWAYHDWHQSGNGESAPFMRQLATEFGEATDLPDFVRKAQMLNYVGHRAIFEGFNAHLWTPSSGRLLWMTQPAWPSTTWQILSSDYDTQASFYGTQKACEPLHVQLDLTDYGVDIVNTTGSAEADVTASAKVYSLNNDVLAENSQKMAMPANAVSRGFKLDLAPLMGAETKAKMVFVRLTLTDSAGKLLSTNFYWLGGDYAAYRQLTKLPPASLSATASSMKVGDEVHVRVKIQNDGKSAALANKLTLENAGDGSRILPAYLSDNYFSLLPGESTEIEVDYPAGAAKGAAKLGVSGWNLEAQSVSITNQ
ncbi:MAG TPA: LamG-like jellyroll fold domain-containing protein [Acidisarcina sp.]